MNGKISFSPSLLGAAALLALTACGGVLPSKRSETQSPWMSFDQAMASYDRIVPGETQMQDLQQLGIDPVHTPNVRRLNYLELIEMFMPHQSIQRSDLDPALSDCLAAREACYAYEVQPGVTRKNRHGNAALDVFGFKRDTRTTGWHFSSLIVLKDETVAYKIWSGEPNIHREESERKPLGPLQNAGDRILKHAL